METWSKISRSFGAEACDREQSNAHGRRIIVKSLLLNSTDPNFQLQKFQDRTKSTQSLRAILTGAFGVDSGTWICFGFPSSQCCGLQGD